MMKNFFKIIVIIFLSLTSAYAQNTANEANEKLSQLLKNMHSLKADFTQTIVDKKGKALQRSTGHMDLQRPNQFRWDVRSPSRQLIITNGKRLWIYDPDLDQVTIRSLVKSAGETPAMLLSDENLALGDEFIVKPITNTPASLEWYQLIPKDRSTVISSLKLGFANQQIRHMQIQDHLGHITLIEFKNAKMNVPISAATFNFKPPAHVDVIDETKTSKH